MVAKFTFVVACCMIGSSSFYAQGLRTFNQNGSFGFKNGEKVVIPAKYDYAADFHNGRAAVCIKKKWGYIDVNGKLVIPMEMDRAENFRFGYVRFYQNGKIGLMDTMGTVIVPPVCNKIETWDGDRWHLENGMLKGIVVTSEKLNIAPEYVSLDFNVHFIICEKTDKTYDVLLRDSKVKVGNSEEKPVMTFDYNTIYCDLSRSGKLMIIDTLGKSVIDQDKYHGITSFHVGVNRKVDEAYVYYDQIYLLQLNDDEENTTDLNENVIPTKFHLFFDENYQFNDAVYTDFGSDEGNYHIVVKKDGLPGYLEDNGKLIFSKYCREERSGDYALLYYKDSTVDIARYQYSFVADQTLTDTIVKYHFPYAEKVLIGDSIKYFSDDEIRDYFEFTYRAEGLFQVKNESGEYALFQVDHGKFLTPFSTSPKMVMAYESFDQLFLVYRESDGSLYFSLDGNVSEKPIAQFENLHGNYLICYQDGTKELIRVQSNTRIPIPKNYGLLDGKRVYNYMLAEEMQKKDWNYGTDWFRFDFDLIVVYDQDKKDGLYGFITKSNKIIEPKFCEIEPLISFNPGRRNHIIQTRIGDKYGWYNYDHDIFVPNNYDKGFTEAMLSGNQNVIELPDSTGYLSVFGTPMQALGSEYDLYSGKFMGLATEKELLGDVVEDTLVPPVFVSVEGLDNNVYLVKTRKGLFGLYNSFGDCILEPKYERIEEMEPMPLDQRFFVFEEDGKKGILETKHWLKTPAIYDHIIFEILENNLNDDIRDNELAIIVKEGKHISTLSNELSPLQTGFDFIFPYQGYNMSAVVQFGNRLGVVDYLSNDAPDFKHLTKEFDFIFDGYGYLKAGDSLKQYELYSMGYEGIVASPDFVKLSSNTELVFNGKTIDLVRKKSRKVIWSTTSRYIRTNEDGGITFFDNGQLQTYNVFTKKTKVYYENN